MKKRSGGPKKSKPAKGFAKSTNAKVNGVQSPAGAEENVASPPPPPPPKVGENGVVRETVTGEEGNATPHQAAVMNPTKLEDPTKEIYDAVEAPVLEPLKNVDELRLDWSLGFDELIEVFEDARKEKRLDKLVRANRHLVSEALLYRFTSAILKVESDGRKEEAVNMRELRRVLIKYSWEMDIPFKKAILAAEERLMKTLQSGNVEKEARRRAGDNRAEVDAYWVVTFAAVAAWEEQGAANVNLKNVDMQKALALVASAYEGKLAEMQSPCLRIVGECLNLSDQAQQAVVLDGLSDEDIVELGAFIEQIRLLPINAYNGLRSRMQTILDFVLSKRYGLNPRTMRPVRFTPQEIERGSKIVSIQKVTTPNRGEGFGGFNWPKFPLGE